MSEKLYLFARWSVDAQRKRKGVYVQVNGNESNVKRAHSLRHKLTTLAAELCYFMKSSECLEFFY